MCDKCFGYVEKLYGSLFLHLYLGPESSDYDMYDLK